MKPVRVRPITLLCIVGFENKLALMIIMTRPCVTIKNHLARSKVKLTVYTQTLCIDFSGACSCPTHTLLCIVRFENNLAQMIIRSRRCVANKNHVTRSKVKVTVHTSALCTGFSETCWFPTHKFVMHGGGDMKIIWHK